MVPGHRQAALVHTSPALLLNRLASTLIFHQRHVKANDQGRQSRDEL